MAADKYHQTHTINFPVYIEEAWRRLKATYPHQSLSGLVIRLLVQYLLKTGFLFQQEIPPPKAPRPLSTRPRKARMTGDARKDW